MVGAERLRSDDCGTEMPGAAGLVFKSAQLLADMPLESVLRSAPADVSSL